ncbi:hypothetical protein BC832DRAFT_105601 [Gaertneriomyces semiglobifer]|nr:hypothetical protein BC832DRAFT_105601 [Gaertneriomyces semiglobifer]
MVDMRLASANMPIRVAPYVWLCGGLCPGSSFGGISYLGHVMWSFPHDLVPLGLRYCSCMPAARTLKQAFAVNWKSSLSTLHGRNSVFPVCFKWMERTSAIQIKCVPSNGYRCRGELPREILI